VLAVNVGASPASLPSRREVPVAGRRWVVPEARRLVARLQPALLTFPPLCTAGGYSHSSRLVAAAMKLSRFGAVGDRTLKEVSDPKSKRRNQSGGIT